MREQVALFARVDGVSEQPFDLTGLRKVLSRCASINSTIRAGRSRVPYRLARRSPKPSSFVIVSYKMMEMSLLRHFAANWAGPCIRVSGYFTADP